MESLILRWIGMGYEPASLVIGRGSFSRRGGILDIFPLACAYPLRIEFLTTKSKACGYLTRPINAA